MLGVLGLNVPCTLGRAGRGGVPAQHPTLPARRCPRYLSSGLRPRRSPGGLGRAAAGKWQRRRPLRASSGRLPCGSGAGVGPASESPRRGKAPLLLAHAAAGRGARPLPQGGGRGLIGAFWGPGRPPTWAGPPPKVLARPGSRIIVAGSARVRPPCWGLGMTLRLPSAACGLAWAIKAVSLAKGRAWSLQGP
jgi:hypothetical protein